jgi:hypothetical protein
MARDRKDTRVATGDSLDGNREPTTQSAVMTNARRIHCSVQGKYSLGEEGPSATKRHLWGPLCARKIHSWGRRRAAQGTRYVGSTCVCKEYTLVGSTGGARENRHSCVGSTAVRKKRHSCGRRVVLVATGRPGCCRSTAAAFLFLHEGSVNRSCCCRSCAGPPPPSPPRCRSLICELRSNEHSLFVCLFLLLLPRARVRPSKRRTACFFTTCSLLSLERGSHHGSNLFCFRFCSVAAVNLNFVVARLTFSLTFCRARSNFCNFWCFQRQW